MEEEMSKLLLGASTSGDAFSSSPMGDTLKVLQGLIEGKMMPKVSAAHKDSQDELDDLIGHVNGCATGRETAFGGVEAEKKIYEKFSPLHKSCRALEAVKHTYFTSCQNDLKNKKQIKDLKCSLFAKVALEATDENAFRTLVIKGASESVDSYIRRISVGFCGDSSGADFPKDSMLDRYLESKELCDKATKELDGLQGRCDEFKHSYIEEKKRCDNLQ